MNGRRVIKNISIRQFMIAVSFTLLFSLAIVVGIRVHYTDIRAGIQDNYISFDLCSAIQSLLLAVILLPVVLSFFELQKRYGFKKRVGKGRLKGAKLFFVFWGIIFACWLPYLMTFYPGGLVGDGIEVVRMALTPGMPSSSHWSVLYVLLVKAVINLGGLVFDKLSDRLFLYSILEAFFFSAVSARICTELNRRFNQFSILSYLTTILFALSGFFATYSMTFWADGVFGALLILLSIQLWDWVEQSRISNRVIVKLFILELLICLWRNNGIYIVAFILLGMLVSKKKAALKSVAAGCIVIAVTLSITGPFYNAMGISKDSVRESISIPLQQMAAVVNSGYDLSPDQEEVLFSALPEEIWRNNYCPALSDDLKFKIDQEYLNTHLADFLTVWSELLLPNFRTYVRAYLMQTLGFWKLDSFHGLYWDYWYGVEDNYNYGLVEKDLLKELTGKTVRPILVRCMWFLPSGVVVWIMLFSILSILYQGKQRKRLMVLLPFLGSWLTVMIATPIAFAYRYVLALAMGLPIMLLLPFYRCDNTDLQKEEKTWIVLQS